MAMQSFKSTGVAKMPKVKAKPFRDGVKPVKKSSTTIKDVQALMLKRMGKQFAGGAKKFAKQTAKTKKSVLPIKPASKMKKMGSR